MSLNLGATRQKDIKTMKRILLSFFFTISVTISFAYDVEVDGIFYNIITKAQEAEVTYKGQTHYEVKTYSGSIVVPNSITVDGMEYTVKSIGEDAFSGCTGLEQVTLPYSITKIGMCAFHECKGLTTFSIPNSVIEIEYAAFSDCSALESINIPKSLTLIPSSAFRGCKSLSSVVIPNSITTIGNSAFYSCTELRSVNLPSSIKTIDDYAFYGCTNLNSLNFSTSVTRIGIYAFSECTSIVSIIIPNSIMSLGWGTFHGCTKLKSVTLGNNVKYINSCAFAECKNLETFTCPTKSVPDTDADTFKDSYIGYSTLIVPEESIEDYKFTSPWKEFGTIKSIESSDIPTARKCAQPTISYENGKLIYASETEGAKIVSEVKSDDIKTSYDNEVALTATYNITAYATKAGYDDSEIATATLVWLDARLDGTSTDAKEITVNAKPLLITQAAGFVTLSGLQDGEKVSAFDALGKQIATSRAIGAETMIDLSSQQGKAAIIKIGGKSVKLMIK